MIPHLAWVKPGTDTKFPAQFAGNWLSVPGFAPGSRPYGDRRFSTPPKRARPSRAFLPLSDSGADAINFSQYERARPVSPRLAWMAPILYRASACFGLMARARSVSLSASFLSPFSYRDRKSTRLNSSHL